MPCLDGGPSYEDGVRERLDQVTAMLCAVCQLCTEQQFDNLMYVPGLRTWWERHQEEDRRRITEENRVKAVADLRRSALEKLTPEERAALRML